MSNHVSIASLNRFQLCVKGANDNLAAIDKSVCVPFALLCVIAHALIARVLRGANVRVGTWGNKRQVVQASKLAKVQSGGVVIGSRRFALSSEEA